MPFLYEIKVNGKKHQAEVGFTTHRNWEEKLDQASITFPFLRNRNKLPMLSLLEITTREVDNLVDKNVIRQKKDEYLVFGDTVKPMGKYGFYEHNLSAMEYTAKLDTYIQNNFSLSRNINTDVVARFEVMKADIYNGQERGVNFYDTTYDFYERVNVAPIKVKATYQTNETITFNAVRKGMQMTSIPDDKNQSLFEYRPMFISTNAPITNNYHILSDEPISWNLPKGKWYIDYGVKARETKSILGGNYWGLDGKDYVVYRHYIEVVDSEELSMYDVLVRLRNVVSKFGGIESKVHFEQTRVFDIDTQYENYLKSIQAPQIYLSNLTVRQTLVFILSYINALPRLVSLNNGQRDLLTLEKFNETQGVFETRDITSFEGNQTTNEIGTRSKSIQHQVLPNNMSEASVFAPSKDNYLQPRATAVQATSNNFELKLPSDKPIYQPKKLVVLVSYKYINNSDLITPILPRELVFTNVELDLTNRFINIEEWKKMKARTNWLNVVSYPIWNKDIGNSQFKTSYLYWQQGDTVIKLSDVYGGIFQTNLVKNVIKEAIFEHFTKNMPEPPLRTDTNGFLWKPSKYTVDSDYFSDVDWKSLRFNLEYISMENMIVNQDKEDLTQVNFYSEMKSNQDENIINVVRSSRKMYSLLQRTGNFDITFAKIHKKLDGIYDIGTKDKNDYTITTVVKEHHNNYIIAVYFATKYHNRNSITDIVDQTYRWKDNYAKTVLDRYESYTDYLIVSPPTDATLEGQQTKITPLAITKAVDHVVGKATSYDDEVSVSLVRTDGFLEDNEENKEVLTFLSIPTTSSPTKQALNFTLGFQDNQIAGDKLVVEDDNNTYNEAVLYTNSRGKFTEFGFIMLKTHPTYTHEDYPIVKRPTLDATNNSYFRTGSFSVGEVGTDALMVYKDTMTNFKLTYEVVIISKNMNDYIIGQAFYDDNPLVRTSKDMETRIYLYTNGYKYDIFNDLKIDDGYTHSFVANAGTNIRYQNGRVEFLGNILTLINSGLITSWAIGNKNGYLYIACNFGFNGFKITAQHFRPNVAEIGQIVEEINHHEYAIENSFKLFQEMDYTYDEYEVSPNQSFGFNEEIEFIVLAETITTSTDLLFRNTLLYAIQKSNEKEVSENFKFNNAINYIANVSDEYSIANQVSFSNTLGFLITQTKELGLENTYNFTNDELVFIIQKEGYGGFATYEFDNELAFETHQTIPQELENGFGFDNEIEITPKMNTSIVNNKISFSNNLNYVMYTGEEVSTQQLYNFDNEIDFEIRQTNQTTLKQDFGFESEFDAELATVIPQTTNQFSFYNNMQYKHQFEIPIENTYKFNNTLNYTIVNLEETSMVNSYKFASDVNYSIQKYDKAFANSYKFTSQVGFTTSAPKTTQPQIEYTTTAYSTYWQLSYRVRNIDTSPATLRYGVGTTSENTTTGVGTNGLTSYVVKTYNYSVSSVNVMANAQASGKEISTTRTTTVNAPVSPTKTASPQIINVYTAQNGFDTIVYYTIRNRDSQSALIKGGVEQYPPSTTRSSSLASNATVSVNEKHQFLPMPFAITASAKASSKDVSEIVDYVYWGRL